MTMYDLGDPVPLAIDVADASGVATNATTVTLTITLPDGTSVTPTVDNPPAVTGEYSYDFATTQAGRHTVRWVTTGPAGAYTDTFDVAEAAPSGIVSLAEVKAHLNITTTTHDEELRRFIDAATDFIEGKIGPVVRRTITKTLYPESGLFYLPGPVIELTSMTSAYGYTASYDVSTVYLDGDAGVIRPAYTSTFSYPVTFEYVAGRSVVPALVRQAALDYVAWMWASQRGPSNPVDLMQGDEYEVRTPATVPYRIIQALEPYMSAGVA